MDSVLWLIHFLAAHTLPYIHTCIHVLFSGLLYNCDTPRTHTVYHAEFRVGKSPILIATDVVGRGLGKP